MKVVYFGCDLFMECLDVFHTLNHDIVAIFTAEDPNSGINKKIREYAISNNIQCINEKPTDQLIQLLIDKGADCFFSIEYNYLIPLPSSPVKTINIHPTLLPEGRGATPLSHLILQYPQFAGITFHKLSNRFDEGDIIFQSPVILDKDENLETLIIKLHYTIPNLLHSVLSDLENLYIRAAPQEGGSYWPKINLQDQLINWHDGIDKINLMIRAFGRHGVITCIENETWLVNHVVTYKKEHSILVGTLLTNDNKICSIAIEEGLVIIYKDSILECTTSIE